VNIDKDLLREQLKAAKERRATGNLAYIKGDTNLRIIPYKDENGRVVIGRKFIQWRPKGEGRPIPHRCNWNKPDVFEQIKESGEFDGEFTWRESTSYLVNAVETDGDRKELRVWQLPATVYESIIEILLDDDYSDAVEVKTGKPFKIKKSGSGLGTKYSVMVGQKSVDVSAFVKGVKDPIDAVEDPGLERQAEALGVDVPEEEEDPEPVKKPTKKPAKPVMVEEDEEDDSEDVQSAPAKKTAKKPSKPEPTEEDEEEEGVYDPSVTSSRSTPKAAGATSIRDLLKNRRNA
jgi:hypothetical protein